jgi:hypothetical protein
VSTCCGTDANRKAPTRARRVREAVAWVVPGAVLVSVPKCPACLAAYVTLWTGFGLSFGAATYLRWGLLVVSAGSLLFLLVNRLDRFGGRLFKRETEPCKTR